MAFITNELSSFGTDYFQINPGGSQISTFAGSEALTFDDLEAIKNDASLTNIKSVAPIAMASVPVSSNEEEDELLTYGITPEVFDMLRPEIIEGEFITQEQEEASERVVVLGSEVAKTFFGENSQSVGENLKINNRNFRVTGVVDSSSALGWRFYKQRDIYSN